PHRSYRPRTEPDQARIEQAIRLIKSARRPILYTGGGIINAGPEASELLREFARLTGAPVTSTLMGLGAFPAANPAFLGMLGMHGTYEANLAMHGCDVMVNLGARFDDRVTGRLNAFAPFSKKIHVDIDPANINKNVVVDIPIIADATLALRALIEAWKNDATRQDHAALADWWTRIEHWREKDSLKFTQNFSKGAIIKPQHAIKRLWELTRDRETYITTEVGQH
ncbi:MAG: acetolactate synthase 3 large subunit, partial [Acidithiobacillus sp.]